MFIMATYVVYVIFLNMLIAIMVKTFKDVLSNEEQNSLAEQVSLMEDHRWLLNL